MFYDTRVESEVEVVVKTIVRKRALTLVEEHQHLVRVGIAESVSTIAYLLVVQVGLGVFLHILAISRVEVDSIKRNMLVELMREPDSSVERIFFKEVVSSAHRHTDGGIVERTIGRKGLSAVYFAIEILIDKIDIHAGFVVREIRK